MALKFGKKKAEKPSWDELAKMDGEALGKVVEEHELDASKENFADEDAAREWIAKKLKIEKSAEEDEEEPTWDDIHALTEAETEEYMKEADLLEDAAKQDFADLAAAHDWICEQFDIKKPEAPAKKGLSFGKKGAAKAAAKPSWEEISKLDEEGLVKTAAEHGVELVGEFAGLSDAQEFLAKKLGVEKPAKKGGLSFKKK